MERWRKRGGGSLKFAPSQSGEGEPYGLPSDKPLGAVKLVECTGEVRSGAPAIFRMMELCGSPGGRMLRSLYEKLSPFRVAADLSYRIVAANRSRLRAGACTMPSRKP
jgi:hypothetical protein